MLAVFCGFEKAAESDWSWGQYVAPAVGGAALVGAGIAGMYFGNKKGLFGKATHSIRQIAGGSKKFFEATHEQASKGTGRASAGARGAAASQGAASSSLREAERYAKALNKKAQEMMSDPSLAKYNQITLSPASEKKAMEAVAVLQRNLSSNMQGVSPAKATSLLRKYIASFEEIERSEPKMKGFSLALRRHFKDFI